MVLACFTDWRYSSLQKRTHAVVLAVVLCQRIESPGLGRSIDFLNPSQFPFSLSRRVRKPTRVDCHLCVCVSMCLEAEQASSVGSSEDHHERTPAVVIYWRKEQWGGRIGNQTDRGVGGECMEITIK